MKLSFIELAGFRSFRAKVRFEIPAGFVVVTGRNGVGKSTLFDAVDFALTGTINKYSVQTAKGGGLADHIWWVGAGKAQEHYVRVGFRDGSGNELTVTRHRDGTVEPPLPDVLDAFNVPGAHAEDESRASMLMKTTLIRDEFIAAMSLDLPGKARFDAVREALGTLTGPDFSDRTGEILKAVKAVQTTLLADQDRVKLDLSLALNSVTDARTAASRSTNASEALRILASEIPNFSADSGRAEARHVLNQRIERMGRINGILPSVEQLSSDWLAVTSDSFAASLAAASQSRDTATAALANANAELLTARQDDSRLRERDLNIGHLATIVEHGEALGLIEGHCPLCDAARSDSEFKAALEAAKATLAEHYDQLRESSARVHALDEKQKEQTAELERSEAQLHQLQAQKSRVDDARRNVAELFRREQIALEPTDFTGLQKLAFNEQQRISELEAAVVTLDSSSAVDQIVSAERRVTALRADLDAFAARQAAVERAVETAKQVDAAAQTVANELLMEQFDTVMPLLRELYRRLRPHVDWTEIESDFGGKVRASLNFSVGEGRNPQFLFSSGQRRAAGLAFLLAIHLSRPWCKWRTLLLDDPVQHIDDYRALNLVEVLSSIRRSGHQVLVAVEDPALADLLVRRLRSIEGEYGRRYDLSCSRDGVSRIEDQLDVAPMQSEALRLAS